MDRKTTDPFIWNMDEMLNIIDSKDFFIFGPRRSGTNYLVRLLLENTINCRSAHMQNNGKIGERLLQRYPAIGERMFSSGLDKHNPDDLKLFLKNKTTEEIPIVILKRLDDWLISRILYGRQFHKQDYLSDKRLEQYVGEYIGFADAISENRELVDTLIVYNQDMLQNLRKLLEVSGCRLTDEAHQINRIVAPGGGLKGEIFVEPNSFDKSAEELQKIVKEAIATAMTNGQLSESVESFLKETGLKRDFH